MAILPLPVFEEELKAYQEDQKVYAALSVPKTLVVRFGFMKMVGEFPYQGDIKPGCGSKIVVKTQRGTEMGEMLTSTCPNSGCSKSVSRKEMLEYIQNSGGRDYPFFEHGRALRVATPEDMGEQSRIEQAKHGMRLQAKAVAARVGFSAKIVEVEPILGNEQVTVFFHSEERIDFRDAAAALQREFGARVEMKQVGARDEARITADYERCGQYCCCKNFLKVLKPVSMRSAKVQKATLDPLKISGRCGRLMCCLRYEDQTYEDLRKRLPRNKSRVGTPDGDGMVLDSQILTQLVLVRLDVGDKDVAVAVEDLTPPKSEVAPERPEPREMDRGRDAREGRENRPRRDSRPAVPSGDRGSRQSEPPRVPGGERPGAGAPGARVPGSPPGANEPRDRGSAPKPAPRTEPEIDLDDIETDTGEEQGSANGANGQNGQNGGAPGGPDEARRKRRRRKRRGGGPGGGGAPGGPQAGPPSA